MRCLRNNSKWLVLGQVLFFFACSLSPEARLTIVPQQVEVPDIVVITFEIDSQFLEIELERIEVIIQNQTTAELWDPEKMTEVEKNIYQYEFEIIDPGQYYVQVQAVDVDLDYYVVEWDYFTATETSITT